MKDGDLLICVATGHPSLFPIYKLHRLEIGRKYKLGLRDVNKVWYPIDFLKYSADCHFILATDLIKALY